MTFNYLFNQRHGALLDTRLKTEEWLIVNWPHWLNWLYNFCVEQQNEYTAARQVISVVSGLASTEHSIIWFTLNLTLEASSWEKQTFSQLGRFNCQTEYCKNRQVNYWVFNSPPSFPRAVNFKYCVLKSLFYLGNNYKILPGFYFRIFNCVIAINIRGSTFLKEFKDDLFHCLSTKISLEDYLLW